MQFYREQYHLSIEEFSAEINLDPITLIQIENNQRSLSLEEAEMISNVLTIDVHSLFDYVYESPLKESDIERIDLFLDALFAQEQIHRTHQNNP